MEVEERSFTLAEAQLADAAEYRATANEALSQQALEMAELKKQFNKVTNTLSQREGGLAQG